MGRPVFQAETMAERRRFPRLALRLPVCYSSGAEVRNVSLFSSSLTHDLGIGGMAMMTNQPLETGELLNLTLYLPASPDTNTDPNPALPETNQPVTLLSRVIWRQHLKEDQYLLGVQFLDLDTENCEHLRAFLRDFKLQEPDLDTPL